MNTQIQETIHDNFYANMPNNDKIAAILSTLDAEDKDAHKNAECRMNNYFNCVDDYSWGGLCDQAASQGYNRRSVLRNALIQLRNNGGAIFEDINLPVLCDMDGNIVSDNVVWGAYGKCWVTPNGQFIGCAKKSATYAKKGYCVRDMRYIIEWYPLGGITQNGNLKLSARVLSHQLGELTEDLNKVSGKPYLLYAAQQKLIN